jgi:hypothetical protein
VAFIYMGRLSSDTAQRTPHDTSTTAPVQIAQATPARLLDSSKPTQHSPVGSVSAMPWFPVAEPASLLLLGSGLLTAGLLGRRLIRS